MTNNIAFRVGQLVRLMLGTDKSGEIVAAAAALKRTLATAGLDHFALATAIQTRLQAIPALAEPEPEPELEPWQGTAQWCFERRDCLNPTDAAFIANIMKRTAPPSPRQDKWLNDIVAKLQKQQQGQAA
jgi:hypothetical protein